MTINDPFGSYNITNTDIPKNTTVSFISKIKDIPFAKYAAQISAGKSLNEIAIEYNLELQTQNNLTKNFSNFENSKKDFYKSLISNIFADFIPIKVVSYLICFLF